MSWQFLLFAAAAVVMIPALRGWPKTALFLAMNVAFVATYWARSAMVLGGAFCLLGYVCARWASRRGVWWTAGAVAVMTGIFIYLRGYGITFLGAGAPTPVAVIGIAGLSFLSFKMLHVIVDAGAGTIEPLPLGRYLNYCLNFTTLLMGPIQRYQDFDKQWTGETPAIRPDFEAHLDAANRVLRGFVKAFVLAPLLEPYALAPGLPIERLAAGTLLLKSYAFYLFLYCDFSGYCDVMIGLGALMGLRPPENFRVPFLARNVSEYWLRVHRSLTLWLTDYVFTPSYRAALRSTWGKSHTFLALAASLMATMLVAGVWHGLALNFVAFGLVHGAALVLVRGYDVIMARWLGPAGFRRFAAHPAVSGGAVILTFNFTALAYTFFVLDLRQGFRVMARLASAAPWLI